MYMGLFDQKKSTSRQCNVEHMQLCAGPINFRLTFFLTLLLCVSLSLFAFNPTYWSPWKLCYGNKYICLK